MTRTSPEQDAAEQKRIAENAAWIASLKRLPEAGNRPSSRWNDKGEQIHDQNHESK